MHWSKRGKAFGDVLPVRCGGGKPDMITPLPVPTAEGIPCWRSGFRIPTELIVFVPDSPRDFKKNLRRGELSGAGATGMMGWVSIEIGTRRRLCDRT
jgi:hypothetical protein